MSSQDQDNQSAAIGRDHHRRVRGRKIVRWVIGGGIAAGIALGVVGPVFQNVPPTPPAASAKTIRRTLATVAHIRQEILHVDMNATETSGTGAKVGWSDDVWIGYPNGVGGGFGNGAAQAGFRQILHHSGISVQTGVFGRGLYSLTFYIDQPGTELYDASTNTIFELQPLYYGPPFLRTGPATGCRGGGAGGFYTGMYVRLFGGTKRWDRRVQANELAGDAYLGGPSWKPFFSGLRSDVPSLLTPCVSEELARQVRYGGAKRIGERRLDGRRVIEYRATGAYGSWTYYADARDQKPVRLVIRGIFGTESPGTRVPKSEHGTLTIDVRTYEVLPFRGNEDLLSLTAQHPGARIDRKADDYYAAQARLFPRRPWG